VHVVFYYNYLPINPSPSKIQTSKNAFHTRRIRSPFAARTTPPRKFLPPAPIPTYTTKPQPQISALPLNPAAPIEQLVPLKPSKRSNTWILEDRDSTSIATNVVIETISNGVGIPGFAAPQTSTSAVTKVQTSFVTHSASVVTVVESSSVDTTCTETTTSLGGLPTGLPGSTPTDATSTPPLSTLPHPSGTASAGFPTRNSSQTFHVSGTTVRSSRPSGTGVRSSRPSGTGIHSDRPSGTGIRPSGSGSVTTIIGSTTTERVYTTVDASAASSVVTVSGVKQSASASAVHLSSSSSGVKVVATATATAVVGGPTAHSTESVHSSSAVSTAHPSSSSVVPKASSSSSVVAKPSSSSSAAKTTSAAATTTKAGGGSPVETAKVVYKGAQKVEPFM
jgi:hypothetical protein